MAFWAVLELLAVGAEYEVVACHFAFGALRRGAAGGRDQLHLALGGVDDVLAASVVRIGQHFLGLAALGIQRLDHRNHRVLVTHVRPFDRHVRDHLRCVLRITRLGYLRLKALALVAIRRVIVAALQ